MSTCHWNKRFCTALLLAATLLSQSAAAATPGTWNGTAEFGTFDMNVTDDGTGIDGITYGFDSWTCGSVTLSGGLGFGPGTPWPIDGGSFSFTNTLGTDQTMTLAGSFTSATQASGTWEADMLGTACDGDWTATTQATGGSSTEVIINHAFIQGVYWNPEELPGWGFFVDLQEDTFFAALFGYLSGQASFITMQGSAAPGEILTWEGDVYYFTDGAGGPTGEKVGEFTWAAGNDMGVPAAEVTMTSNLLNVDRLPLARFSFAEQDEVDVLTGANWNVVRHESGGSSSDYYEITDNRITLDGITYAEVIDLNDLSMAGAVGFFELIEGDFYAMLVEFDDTRDAFYVFLATDSDMYGQFWLVTSGAEPEGDGEHFRATSDSLFFDAADGGGGTTAAAAGMDERARFAARYLQDKTARSVTGQGGPDVAEADMRRAFRSLSEVASNLESAGKR